MNFFQESIETAQTLGDKSLLLRSIYGLDTISIEQRDFDKATVLLSILDLIRSSLGVKLSLEEQKSYENMMSAVSISIKKELFKTLWLNGQQMSFDQIVDFALKVE